MSEEEYQIHLKENKENGSIIFYHGTTETDFLKIQKEGFKLPSEGAQVTKKWKNLNTPDAIGLTESFTMAYLYARYRAKETNDNIAIVTVEVPPEAILPQIGVSPEMADKFQIDTWEKSIIILHQVEVKDVSKISIVKHEIIKSVDADTKEIVDAFWDDFFDRPSPVATSLGHDLVEFNARDLIINKLLGGDVRTKQFFASTGSGRIKYHRSSSRGIATVNEKNEVRLNNG